MLVGTEFFPKSKGRKKEMDNYEHLRWELDEGRITHEQFSKRADALRKSNENKYEHFESINSVVIKDPEFCKKFSNPLTLYMYLRTLVIRTGPLKHRTYGRNALVSLVSEEKLAEQFGTSVRTVQRWLDQLVKEGLIKKAKLKQWGKGREYCPNLYQLGYINKDGRQDYFIDKGYFRRASGKRAVKRHVWISKIYSSKNYILLYMNSPIHICI